MATASSTCLSQSSTKYSKQQLEDLKRTDLQKVYKTEGLKGANQKSEILIEALLSHFGNGAELGSGGGALDTRGKENVGPLPAGVKRTASGAITKSRSAAGSTEQNKIVTELQTQVGQLAQEIAELRTLHAETEAGATAQRQRVEVLEARDVEWAARLKAVEMKWAESMASVQDQLDKLARAGSFSSLPGITEESIRPHRHSSVPATPRSSSATRLTFAAPAPSATLLGKRQREDDLPPAHKFRVVSTASVYDTGVVDGLLEEEEQDEGLRTPPPTKAMEPKTPPPGVHTLPRDLPSPSPAQKKRTLSGLGVGHSARLVSASLAPPPSPRADRDRSPAPRMGHGRLPSTSTRIDALFGSDTEKERSVIPLEPMHAPFNDPSSTPTAIDRAISISGDRDEESFVASPVIPDLLGPELSRLSPFPVGAAGVGLGFSGRKSGMGMGMGNGIGRGVPPTPPAMPTLFGTERSRDTRFGDEAY